ncbi:hypothetical protein Avbf_03948 [Armadillidium vulgare]|nr:hypothetical protein Avbf_03948 [Armadillidium vulgare]
MKFLSYLFKLYIYICLFVNECNARNKSKLFNYKLMGASYEEPAFNKSTRNSISYIKNYQINAENTYARTFLDLNSSRSINENSQEGLISKFNSSRNTHASLKVYDSVKEYAKSKNVKHKSERKKQRELPSHGIDICLTEDYSHDNGIGKLRKDVIDYYMNSSSFKIVTMPPRTSSRVTVTSVSRKSSDFLVFEAHSQIEGIILSYVRQPAKECFVNNTNAALVLFVDKSNGSLYSDHTESEQLLPLLLPSTGLLASVILLLCFMAVTSSMKQNTIAQNSCLLSRSFFVLLYSSLE